MKIIIINGSPRKNGATAKILKAMGARLSAKSADVEFVNISDLNMSHCAGCCSCYTTGKCYMDDDAEELSQRIDKADGIIIGSPTYASNISGQLKQLIDRGHFVIEQLLYGKYAVYVATGENYGNGDTGRVLDKLIKYSGGRVSGKIVCNVPFNSNLENSLMKKAEAIADRLFDDIRGNKRYVFQTLFHKVIFDAGIKPFVLRKGESYNGVISHWRRKQIIQD